MVMVKNFYIILAIGCLIIQACSKDETDIQQFNGCLIHLSGNVETVSQIKFSICEEDVLFQYNGQMYKSPYIVYNGKVNGNGLSRDLKIGTNGYVDHIDVVFSLNNTDLVEKKVTIDIIWLLDDEVVKKSQKIKKLQPGSGVVVRW